MGMQETGKVEPVTANSEKLSAVQEIPIGTSVQARTICTSTEQHTSMHLTSGALDIVDRLRGVVFWRPEGKHDLGVIAENLADVVRGAIAHNEGGEDAKAVDLRLPDGCVDRGGQRAANPDQGAGVFPKRTESTAGQVKG